MEIVYFLGSFILMEVASWFIHKYLMHGVLWNIHRTHHEHKESFLELNDVFSLFFGSIAAILIYLGAKNGFDGRFWAGVGVSTYGMLYFVLHDIMIHKRLKWFGRSQNKYLQAISKAHAAHHRTREKDGSESFGLLVVAKKFFQ